MIDSDFTWFTVLTRMLFALVLVLLTYNPEGYSYYHWGILNISADMPAKVLIGLVLVLAWALYIRSAGESFGYMGTFITLSFFSTFLWVVVRIDFLPNVIEKILIYFVLILVSWIVATGFSLSLPPRKGKPTSP